LSNGADKPSVVVLDDEVRGPELSEQLARSLGSNPGRVIVVAPAITDSALKSNLGDVDEAIPAARERLEQSLAALREAGIEAEGEVGDSDPIQAISDEIVKFDPGRIIVVGHPRGEEPYEEKGLLERAERDFDIPVTELLIEERGDRQEVVDTETTRPERPDNRGDSYNVPRFTRRQQLGMAVAIIGTLLLALIATAIAGSDNSNFLEEDKLWLGGRIALLIALFMTLLNLAHVVGLFIFQSQRYEGIWSRFFSRLSFIGTPIAVAVTAAIYFLH
jgi:hypothetical protein